MHVSDEMSRGEMIRRLDEASKDIHERLENGPLTQDERRALAASLSRLLPLVADSLQQQADIEAAEALRRSRPEPPTT
jgi:predicted Zn-dependent peptidase